jgi:ubiquinone/menaquinone biosynthesis C-methylase UbiE
MSRWQAAQDRFYADAAAHTHLHFNPNSVYAAELTARLSHRIGLTPSSNVLEVGCGAGRFSLHLVPRVGSLVALDTAEALLGELRRRGGAHAGLKPTNGSAYDLAAVVPTASLDAACGFFILHHLQDHGALFRSIQRTLKPGGRVAFLEPNRINPSFLVQVAMSREMTWEGEKGMFTFSSRRTVDLFRELGFVNVSVERLGLFPPAVLDRWPGFLRVQHGFERIAPIRRLLAFSLISAEKAG